MVYFAMLFFGYLTISTFFRLSPYAENFSIKKQFIKKLLKAFFICQSFLLTPADGTIRFFDGFKIIFSIKEKPECSR